MVIFLCSFFKNREILNNWYGGWIKQDCNLGKCIESFQDIVILFSQPWGLGELAYKLYRPVVSLSYSINFKMSSLNEATIYHATDLLVHYINGLFIYLIIKKITNNFLPGLIGLSLFIFHPAVYEIIPTLDRRHEVIAGMFGLLSLFYVEKSKTKFNRAFVFSLFFYLLGNLSKEIIVVFIPPLMFLSLFGVKKVNYKNLNLGKITKSFSYLFITISIWVFTQYLFKGYQSYNKILDHTFIELIERSNVFFSNFLYHTIPNIKQPSKLIYFVLFLGIIHTILFFIDSKNRFYLIISFSIILQFLFVESLSSLTILFPNVNFVIRLILNVYLIWLMFYLITKITKATKSYFLVVFTLSLLCIFGIRVFFGFLGLRGGYVSSIFFVFIISLIVDFILKEKVHNMLYSYVLFFWIVFIVFSGVNTNILLWNQATNFNKAFYNELSEIIESNSSIDKIILEDQPYIFWDYEYGRPNTIVYSVQEFTVDAWLYHNFPNRKINVEQLSKSSIDIKNISSNISLDSICVEGTCNITIIFNQ